MLRLFSRVFLAVCLLGALCGAAEATLDGKWQCDVRETVIHQGIAPNAEAIDKTVEALGTLLNNIVIEIDSKAETLAMSMDGVSPLRPVPYIVKSLQGATTVLEVSGEVLCLTLGKGSKGQEILIFSSERSPLLSVALVREGPVVIEL